jgi:hypothetical protein
MVLNRKNLTKLQTPQYIDYKYTIQGQLENITTSGPKAFNEAIFYNGSWSGNITRARYSYTNLATTKENDLSYTYGKTSRLNAVGTTDAGFQANYSHDNAGRLKTKREGTLSNNDAYDYYTGTNRLKKAKSVGGEIYIYDGLGNCVIDMSKKMVIQYDWRDMPVCFTFYRNIPAGESSTSKIKPDSKGTFQINDSRIAIDDLYKYCAWASGQGEMEVISTVYMLYDASGNRVMKIGE